MECFVATPNPNPVDRAHLTEQPEHMRGIAQAIEHLAEQFLLPISDVHEIVRIHLHQLEQRSRIKQYISILAIKQAKESLRTTQSNHAA